MTDEDEFSAVVMHADYAGRLVASVGTGLDIPDVRVEAAKVHALLAVASAIVVHAAAQESRHG